MRVTVQVAIDGSKTAIWEAMNNIENASKIITGIESIELLEKPMTGIIGLKWRETRFYFGELATIEKQITEAVENQFYKTKAESDGFLFLSTTTISDENGVQTLISVHEYFPQGFAAKLKSLPMFLFKGVIKKALLKDLNDIKSFVERK